MQRLQAYSFILWPRIKNCNHFHTTQLIFGEKFKYNVSKEHERDKPPTRQPIDITGKLRIFILRY